MVQSWNLHAIFSGLKVLRNPSLIVPHIVVPDIRAIDFKKLRTIGIKAIAFDKDNCLTAPYVSEVYPPFLDAWKACCAEFQQNVIIVSNSAGTLDDPGYKEAQQIEASLGVHVLRHEEKKPAGGSALLAHFGNCDPWQVAIVGDRLFTDVLLGNMSGMLTIFAKEIVTESGDNPLAVHIRRLEHYLLRELKKFNVPPPYHPYTIFL